MICSACGHESRAGRKFCAECGAALALACAACGTPYETGEKFCGECGATLAGAPRAPAPQPSVPASPSTSRPTAGARKVVTVVFADLVGSTALHERLDAEAARRFMEGYYAAMRSAVESHGGTVTQFLGDGVKAVFGIPRVAEDDAIRAVRAAVAMQRAFRDLAERQRGAVGHTGLRVAVNTGEVVADDATEIIGDPVNVAARLQEKGGDGDVVVGESTRRLVAALVTLELLGSFALKGRSEAVRAYRVESLEPPAGAAATPFVGRDQELRRLTAVYDAAVAAPAARLAVLLGSPGLGKSRLIDELARRSADAATVLAAHCDAAGGATFAPLIAALRAHLGIEDAASPETQRAAIEAALAADSADRARIASGIVALLAGTPASPEETFFVVRRLLGALARTKPVVLVIDDLHWAEPLLLDLVEHLVQWGSGVPLFVLVGARPELRDLRSSLVTSGGLVADVVTLGGLDAGAAMRLAANVIGAADLPAAVAAKVLATSEGNPLFVGELVRMLVQEGALTKDGDRWTAGAGLASIEMPPTIHALLAARIERLPPDERTVLERASVVGRHFSRGAVAALLARNGTELDARLEALRRSELIERDTGWLLGEPALRFHHVLIRDAAYRRLLKGTRAELHERLADWIEGQVGDAPEHDETIGWHLEQAHQHLRELGPLDTHGRALGERAATRLAAAGRRALARDDVSLAAGLLGRAIDRLDAGATARAALALDWCEALLSAGDVGSAAAAIDELGRFAEGSERLRGWHTCFAAHLAVLTAPEDLRAAAERVAGAARDLAAQDDAAGEAKAHFVHAQALARLGKVGACEAALDQALAAARRAGDRRRANAVLAGAPLAALWGPSPVTRASGRCLDVVRVLRITQGAPAVEAVALSCQGVLEALRGRTEAARRMLASSRKMVEELGITQRLYEVDVAIARVDLLERDAAAAERRLRPAYEGLRDLGLGIDAAGAAALLGRALLAQGRAAEAERLSHDSESLAGDDLQAAIAWRGVRAEALAARGEPGVAVELAAAAVEIAAATDALLDHADARLALATALRAAGRGAEADAEERRAIELWGTKGATLLVERPGQTAVLAAPAAGPTATPSGAPTLRRRVRPNAATTATARFEAAVAAHDEAALAGLFSDALEVVDHQNAATYGRAGQLDSVARLLRMRDVTLRVEPLATLGDSLLLWRRRIHAGGTAGGRFDVGEVEREEVVLFEVDDASRVCRIEIFGANRLKEAIAGLYARYAEVLPEGPHREHARRVAQCVAVGFGTMADLDALAAILAPDIETVDRRTLGTWSARGAATVLDHYRALNEVASAPAVRDHDVLALEPNAALCLRTHGGTERLGGGAYERYFLVLFLVGPDGRIARMEFFDADCEAEALARFDALTARPVAAAPPVGSRVRPNAVTRVSAEFEAIAAARDLAALATFFAADAECVDHPTGVTYGADAMATGIRHLLQSPDARLRFVPLATLGASWGLVRREMSASGAVGARFDVGPYEIVDVSIFGTDERGRLRHVEIFAVDRLRAALVRLYERYAESLPEGAARARASGTARALATFDGPLDADRAASGIAPSFECVDHRTLATWSAQGREEWRRHWREQADLAIDFTNRDDEVLALDPGATAIRGTFSGRSRASGGTFENVIIYVNTHGADGLIMRSDVFESDQEAAALACFDALTAGAAPKRPVQRRVRPNAATRTNAAIEAAFARRDLDAIDALLGDPLQTIEHPTATTYGREGQIETSRRLMRMPDLEFRIEPLATLGESLALSRRLVTASGRAGSRFDVGAYELESIVLNEVDEAGRLRSSEVFASDHLCQATARLYARFAGILPEGPERTRVAGIARSHSVWDGPLQTDRVASVVAPSYVCVDHRSLRTWSSNGREEWLRHWHGQADLAVGFSRRDDDILAFAPGVNVTRHIYYGTNRASGGPFQNVFLAVNVLGADGLYTRCELFDPDRETEAIARFDAITGAPGRDTGRRRVRPNAAIRSLERFAAVLAARDDAALAETFDESLDVVHHPTRATYGRRAMLVTWRSLIKAKRLEFRSEPLASLGDALALERHVLSFEGFTEAHLADAGPGELEEVTVIQTDARGRWLHCDIFASDRLADAILRLYERHAELLPEGSTRARAAGTARSVATHYHSATDPDRFAAAFAPGVVAVDHRTVGFGTLHGRDAVITAVRALLDLADDVTWRFDDVLALSEHANLVRGTQRGRGRASGGEWERAICSLRVHDTDGLIARWEIFEAEQEAAGLARYDELVGAADPVRGATPAEPRFANAATRFLDRYAEVWTRRDWPSVSEVVAPGGSFEDRRPLLRMQVPKDGFLEQHRVLFEVPNSRWTFTMIATRGERLAIADVLFQGEVAGGGGALEIDHLGVFELDADGRMAAIVIFEPADLDAAYAELDARFEGGEAVAYPVVVAYLRANREARERRDWDALAATAAPEVVIHDHRSLSLFGTLHGRAAHAGLSRTMIDQAPDARLRFEHLRLSDRGFLCQGTWSGTRDGGSFEITAIGVCECGSDGTLVRYDAYDVEQTGAAWARFEAIGATIHAGDARAVEGAAVPRPTRFANAATATAGPVIAAMIAHDWQAFARLFADDFRCSDRRRVVQLELDREQYIAFTREVADGRTIRATSEVVATRGERLALARSVFEFADADVGPSEISFLILTEVDERGRIVAYVRWDIEDVDAAYAELDARWCAWEEKANPRGAAYQVAFDRGLAHRDWDALAALYAPTVVARDHRLVGWDVLHGPTAFVGVLRAMVDLAPDAWSRADHVRAAERGRIGEVVWRGTRDGGAFESAFIHVVELEADGKAQRLDLYDLRHVDRALARFGELHPDPLRIPPNAVARAWDRWLEAVAAGAADTLHALYDPSYRFDDRRRLFRMTLDLDAAVRNDRLIFDDGWRAVRTLLATAGDRLALQHVVWTTGETGAASEIEMLMLDEVDREGRFVSSVAFDPDDRAAASAELFERYAAGEGDMPPAAFEGVRAWNAHDLDRLRALLPADYYLDDRRRTGVGRLDGAEAYLASLAAVWELSRDLRIETLYLIAVEPQGTLYVCRWFGTNAEGGAFDAVYVCFGRAWGERLIGFEIFELDDLETARARFEALRPSR